MNSIYIFIFIYLNTHAHTYADSINNSLFSTSSIFIWITLICFRLWMRVCACVLACSCVCLCVMFIFCCLCAFDCDQFLFFVFNCVRCCDRKKIVKGEGSSLVSLQWLIIASPSNYDDNSDQLFGWRWSSCYIPTYSHTYIHTWGGYPKVMCSVYKLVFVDALFKSAVNLFRAHHNQISSSALFNESRQDSLLCTFQLISFNQLPTHTLRLPSFPLSLVPNLNWYIARMCVQSIEFFFC